MSAFPLSGRHAIVTGGGRGIGRAIAHEIAGLGADLTLMGRDMTSLESAAQEIKAQFKSEVACVSCDVGSRASVESAFSAAKKKLGACHILVNNAGQVAPAPVVEITGEQWEKMLSINLTGTLLCAQQVLPDMVRAASGRINIASTAGLKGYPRLGAYCVSKHGVIGLTRTLALEVVKQGITVNAVCPSYTESDMTAFGIEAVSTRLGVSKDEASQIFSKQIPRGSLIKPEEVASAVGWLCRPEASGVTGQCIVVAGGELA